MKKLALKRLRIQSCRDDKGEWYALSKTLYLKGKLGKKKVKYTGMFNTVSHIQSNTRDAEEILVSVIYTNVIGGKDKYSGGINKRRGYFLVFEQAWDYDIIYTINTWI